MRGTNWEKRQDTKAGLCERISNFKRCLLRRRSLIEEFRKKSIRESDNVTPFWLHHRGIFSQRCKKRIAGWSLLPANIERWWLTRVNQLSRVQVFISSRGKRGAFRPRKTWPGTIDIVTLPVCTVAAIYEVGLIREQLFLALITWRRPRFFSAYNGLVRPLSTPPQ